MGVWYQVAPAPRLSDMSLETDLLVTAVAAVERAIAGRLPHVPTETLQGAAEDAVDAARPFLDGAERRRVLEADSTGTVTS